MEIVLIVVFSLIAFLALYKFISRKKLKSSGCKACGLVCTCGGQGRCDVCKRERFHYEGVNVVNEDEVYDLESGYSQSFVVKTRKF